MPYSYNGWEADPDPDRLDVAPFTVAGITFPAGVKAGDVHTVLHYVATQWHERVEPLESPGCWGYAYRQNRNSDNLSCHASATAIDLNAPKHPNGQAGTVTAAQRTEIRQILAEVDWVCAWGGDFSGTKDEMHVEVRGTTAQVAAVAARLRQPKPTMKELPEMVIIVAEGKPLCLFTAGRLVPLDDLAEKAALEAAGVPSRRVSPAQFVQLDQISKRS